MSDTMVEVTYRASDIDAMLNAIIAEFDDSVKELKTKKSQGDWTKTDDAMDVLLDARQKVAHRRFEKRGEG